MKRDPGNVILAMRGTTKRFGGLVALDNVDLTLHEGEILALVGDNGAGKSTLMKILAGIYTHDAGEIWLRNKKVRIATPQEARRLGIGMVYQDLALVEMLSASANVFLGAERRRWRFFLDSRRMKRETWELLNLLKVKLESVRDPVISLSGGQRAVVAIARVLHFAPKVVVLDEPTAALDPGAVEKVLTLIKGLAEEGVSVIVICHRLEDIFAIAHSVTLLHQGNNAWQGSLEGFSADTLMSTMLEAKSRLSRRGGG